MGKRIEHRLRELTNRKDPTLYERKLVTLKDYQIEWLREHDGINFSGIIQEFLDGFMIRYDYNKLVAKSNNDGILDLE